MEMRSPRLGELVGKSIVTHTVTYFLMGLFAFFALDYREAFSRSYMACWMRSVDDPLIAAGPLFQPIRGVIFALAFYPLREVLFGRRQGWLIMWWILVALGVLSTFGPAPGSVEGLVYTLIPPLDQMRGWIEVVPQAFLFAALLYVWVERPGRRWWSTLLIIAFFLVLAMAVAGMLAAGAGA